MNLIIPVILIIASIGTFFTYIDPNYRGTDLGNGKKSIVALKEIDAQYQEALNGATEIRNKREALMIKSSEIADEDMSKLLKLLPDNVDNIKLVININSIAKNHALVLKDIKLDESIKSEQGKLSQDNNKYGTVGLSFSVSSSYDNFQNFLNDLEKSLRLVEITGLSVTANDSGVYDFSVNLKTYWLK